MTWLWPLECERCMPDEPGRFAAVRKHDVHTGVDLYALVGSQVVAVEDGIVVAIENFTGPAAGSPWWLDTKAVLVEGSSGVVCYGEVDPSVRVDELVRRGSLVGRVLEVLRRDKGRPRSMLHVELYEVGVRTTVVWALGQERPAGLLDPTEFLESSAEGS